MITSASANTPLPVWDSYRRPSHLAEPKNDPMRHISASVSPILLHSTRQALNRLAELTEDWDGYGSSAPIPGAVPNAYSSLDNIYAQILESLFPWKQPYVSSNENGEVVFEWWSGQRKLTLYIGERRLEYIKVWGPSITTQMADGVLTLGEFYTLWNWLHNPSQ